MSNWCGTGSRRHGRRIRLLAGLCIAASAGWAQANLDSVVESARKEFDVPGIAVAVVKDGRVVLEKGYGIRKLGETAPVTPRTLFRIASNTKAFTAAALAMLVDEGKVRWDQHVVDVLRGFQMYDPYVTREMTVADLLVHRSGLGLGEGDLMFFPPSDLTREQIIGRLRFLKPARSFRSGYAYDNLLYLVAGQIIPVVTGTSWDNFVKDRIFAPLGMRSSGTSTQALETGADVATPHSLAAGTLEAIHQENVDNNAPAGSIISSVNDLAKWAILQLNHGESGGTRLFSEAQSKRMWSPETILPIEETAGAPAALRPTVFDYGLGWFLRDYRGTKMVYHTGGLSGFVSRVTLIPDEHLGVIVLTNQEAGAAFNAVTFTVLDHYLGAPLTDWVAVFGGLQRREAADAEAAVRKASGKRETQSHPSLPLTRYAGRYRDAWYGDIAIEEQAGKLAIRFTHTPQLSGRLEHWQYDTFVARWSDRSLNADAYVTFSLKPDGSIDEAKMAAVSPATDFSFDFQDLLLKPVPAGAPPR